jgi:hypothetical protein
MSFIALTTAETDAKSPMDDDLWKKVKDNFDDLDSRVITAGAKTFNLELWGQLSFMARYRRSVCFGILNEEFQPSRTRFMLKKSGTSGTLAFDIRRQTSPETPIIGIDHQYTAATSSIAQAGASLSTQSIVRATTQILTQSITHAKATKAVQSIILLDGVLGLGVNLVQYNLDTSLDSDTLVGDGIVFASCTNAANNGTFTIVEKNRGGGFNVVISNVAGVAQTGIAGNGQVKIMSYNFTNPVDSNFAAGFFHEFSAHTTGSNNGDLLVYAINQSGNNVWVKNNTGAAQAGVAGALDTNFWVFALTVAASTTDYIVGEFAKTAAHTSGGNNAGALQIIAVNSGGNNLVLYNINGVTQGGIAGNINTNRWIYALPSDPSSQITAGDTVNLTGHTTAANNGVFPVKEVNRAASNNIVIYNEAGVAQGGAVGTTSTTRKLVKFSSDQSAVYTTNSFIEMKQVVDDTNYNLRNSLAPFRVLQINRGGGANFNVVIDVPTGGSQASPSGYIQLEMKSIFTSAPTLSSDVTGLEANQNPVGTSTSFVVGAIPAQTPLALYLTSVPSGDPKDLTVSLL